MGTYKCFSDTLAGEIREAYARRDKMADMVERFGVLPATIRRVVRKGGGTIRPIGRPAWKPKQIDWVADAIKADGGGKKKKRKRRKRARSRAAQSKREG